ncbi:cytokine-inducible SH2-containing protein isoform X2 [Temnothorax curvispinosus]|uniref:Cytokine-inducible SH2-containing protein isoform X2 n=1 Tax=Temnothorax curvispinosus TaxID=300111 RepID=A0A6J1QEE9_9HYME|nr:cytokine-inducible SH2-containing protein isoform X2 [Temnothorax curvispinosus]
MTDRSRDPESTASTAAEQTGARRKSRRGNTSGKLATLLRRCEGSRRQEYKREDPTSDTRSTEHRFKGPSSSKLSFLDFVCNVKKHLLLKNLCKSKKRSKETETTSPCSGSKQNNVISVIESLNSCQKQDVSTDEQALLSDRRLLYEARLVPTRQQAKLISDIATVNDATVMQPTYSNTMVAVSNAIAQVPGSVNETLNNEHKVKASLAKELLNLSKYGWYWGPISGDEADAKLISEPDGAFLVRDSSDDRYVLTLSFKSSGKMLHARMEHSGGLFSLCNQSTENEGFNSVAALINHSMNFSQSAVICYSRPKYPGYPSFPVRLTKPVSRFTQVRSLQYLCRFVIRQYIRLDNIHKLPLPKTIKGYIQEAHY